MHVRILLQITADDGAASLTEEVTAFEKSAEWPEDLGLSLAEGKAVTAAIQRQVVNAQVASWTERHRGCEACGVRRRSKGSSTVNAVISKRFAKRQQMQWTQRGAYLLLQTRTRTLDGTLRPLFERWYPGLANDNGNGAAQAAAA